MPVNLPQPMFVPGGQNKPRSTAEQAMLTFLGQAPGLAFTLFNTLQQNQQVKAEQDAAIQTMFLEAQAGNPEAQTFFASQGGLGAISPQTSPLDPEVMLPGSPPAEQLLDTLSSDVRRMMPDLVDELTGLQTRRVQRGEVLRAERREERDIERFEKEMEHKDIQIRGDRMINDIRKWEQKVMNPLRQRDAELNLEITEVEAAFARPIAQAQLAQHRQTMVLQAQEQGMRHWESLQNQVSDLVRIQMMGMQSGTSNPDVIRAQALDITQGLLQGRSASDYMQLYEEYFGRGAPTAEQRSEFYAKLAGDTWQTMAVNYGYSTEEAIQFRDDLEGEGSNMRIMYRDRMKQISAAEQVRLNNVDETGGETSLQWDNSEESIRQYYEQERASYKFLINLWRDSHGMRKVKWPELTEAERSHTGKTLFEMVGPMNPLSPVLGPARVTNSLDLSGIGSIGASGTPGGYGINPPPALASDPKFAETLHAIQRGLQLLPPDYEPEEQGPSPLGNFLRSLEQTMFGPQDNSTPAERAKLIFGGGG